MGSTIEINDTLQITKEQGFPKELDFNTHLSSPYKIEEFQDNIFDFKDKDNIRVFQSPPVRVFLAENISGKWIYWGLCQILEVTCDYVNKKTSGKYKITHFFSPEEMKNAHKILDGDEELTYFSK